jgi:hypothetical protein
MSAAGGAVTDLPYRSAYALLGYRVAVATNSAEFLAALDRLNSEFLTDAGAPPHAAYEVVALAGGRLWDLTFQGEEWRWCDSLPAALGQVEWHIVERAVAWRPDLLQVHGAALAGPASTVLLPGASGIGKTTLALALRLRGLRLYADDVVFIEPASGRPLPFPRSPHVHDDALARLAALGLRYDPADHLGRYLCAAALRPWPLRPGPRLRAIILLEPPSGDAPALAPITQAEAAVELLRLSENLKRFPRAGLDLLPALLRDVACYRLRRNDDLAAAAELICQRLAGRRSTRPRR